MVIITSAIITTIYLSYTILMRIEIASGAGTGKTELSAFDAALYDAGVHNYNLLLLSSIIPPQSKVIKIKKFISKKNEFGDRLYIVQAKSTSKKKGEFISAGLGWYQIEDGRGVFVEHKMIGQNKSEVSESLHRTIRMSIKDLCQFRNFIFYENNIKEQIVVKEVKNDPVCVLVIAVYQSEEWSQADDS